MPRKVLYIDDDAGLCALVKRTLGREGIEVVTASDGESGLKLLGEQADIDIVAVDLYMPGLGGIELTERINRLPNHPPVIVVTGAQDSRMAVAALKAGAFDYVVKEVQGEFTFLLKAACHAAADAMRTRRAKEAAEAEVRAARDRFEALAAERALLMREVNHRVGNSLQLIASLLTIQSNAAANAEVKEALSDATGRVMAVAQVHRRLYTSDDVQSVAVELYLEALVEDLRRSTAAEGGVLAQLTLQAEPMAAAPDHAVALGMIVNELVTNALKYAYPDGKKGAIRVLLRRNGDNHAVLSVEDDGVGNSSNGAAPAPVRSTGLGQRIVHAMGDKLHAHINHVSGPNGTRVTVDFDLFSAPAVKASAPKPAA
ncbi:MAG: response regulator [Proteobacteria bacterium]|nr:response regulator [Pseudomonadota bacterium]